MMTGLSCRVVSLAVGAPLDQIWQVEVTVTYLAVAELAQNEYRWYGTTSSMPASRPSSQELGTHGRSLSLDADLVAHHGFRLLLSGHVLEYLHSNHMLQHASMHASALRVVPIVYEK